MMEGTLPNCIFDWIEDEVEALAPFLDVQLRAKIAGMAFRYCEGAYQMGLEGVKVPMPRAKPYPGLKRKIAS